MSNSYLHKDKGKSKRGVYGEEFKDYPQKVQQYYDRHCGSTFDKVSKMEAIKHNEKNKRYEDL